MQIQNPDAFLRPDMNATVLFVSESSTATHTTTGVLVPSSALHVDQNGAWVLVAYEGRAMSRVVHKLGEQGDGVLVSGLSSGEDVIVAASSSIKNGSRIRQKQ